MNLVKYDVAHDGHPDESGEEEEDVEVADHDTSCVVDLLDLRVSLYDDQEEEGQEEGQCKVQHHLVVVRPGYGIKEILFYTNLSSSGITVK